MKTLEQKAKAYDEALEKAKSEYQTHKSFNGFCEMLVRIFPELKESEDEGIRKELLEHCKNQAKPYIQTGNKCPQIQSWLAWLEKQGDKDKFIEKELGCIKGYRENAIKRLEELEKQDEQEKDVLEDAILDSNEDGLIAETIRYKNEKQGEQKANYTTIVETGDGGINAVVTEELSTDKVEPKFKVGDKIRRKNPSSFDKDMQVARIEKDYYICNHIGKFSSEVVPFSKQSGYELIEQNLANNIEPKFKVGYWVTNSIETVQITGYDIDYGYQVDYKGNLQHRDTDIIEKEYHLWTIQDAKDGDVLQLGKVTAIFQKYISDGNCKCYCSVCDEEFEIPSQDGVDNIYGCHNAIPATNEQRDLLFQKMNEAGYEWDSDTKELKKIEQEHAELAKGEDYGIDGLWHAQRILEKTFGKVDGYQTDDGILSHECAISAVKELYEKKPAWSEEDEEMLRSVIATCELAEQDRDSSPAKHLLEMQTNWLKSLRPQNRWKPSDEQMELLSEVQNALLGKDCHNRFTDFIWELKKLKEG